MNESRRDLMMRVMDGDTRTLHYLHHIDHHTRCDEMLAWLIKNHLTGKEFTAWVKCRFGTSMLDMSCFILGKLQKQKKEILYYGVDIR